MKKFLALFLALCFFAVSAEAKPKHFYTDWKFWVGEGIIVTAWSLDAHSSIMVEKRCPWCIEQNKILGKHPSPAQLRGVAAAGIGITSGLHIAAWYLGHDDPNRFWRNLARWEVPVIVGAGEGYYAGHNYYLAGKFSHCQPGQVTCK